MSSLIQQALQQQKPFPSIEGEVFVALQLAANRALDPWARFLRQQERLTPNQYNVLRILRGAHPAGLTCGQIADRMITRDPDVTRLTDRLVRDGLAHRARNAADRRVVEVSIAPEGLATLDRLEAPSRAMAVALLGSIGSDRLVALRDLLGTLVAEIGTFAPRHETVNHTV
ncbi:MAG: MarR family transcriptional regulator [Gemmatimonadota bacterium]|nr:MarR family transcriptional regulator [Gemmatimonadota bacterium]